MNTWSCIRAPLGVLAALALGLSPLACGEAAPAADPAPQIDSRSEVQEASAPTIVVLVRHAEKEEVGDDPVLTSTGRERGARLAHVLSEGGLDAVYASQYRRTQETAEIVASAVGIEVTIVDARDVEGLAARLREEHAGQRVLVVGHSNTVPAVVRALGAEAADIPEDEYDDLFVVYVHGEVARAVQLNYGAMSGGD
jgi:phosphohistidine phosphatase SixA